MLKCSRQTKQQQLIGYRHMQECKWQQTHATMQVATDQVCVEGEDEGEEAEEEHEAQLGQVRVLEVYGFCC